MGGAGRAALGSPLGVYRAILAARWAEVERLGQGGWSFTPA